MKPLVLAAVCVGLLVGCAGMRRDWYYTKPGVSQQEIDRDTYECAREARSVVHSGPPRQNITVNIGPADPYAPFTEAMRRAGEGAQLDMDYRNVTMMCLKARGYQFEYRARDEPSKIAPTMVNRPDHPPLKCPEGYYIHPVYRSCTAPPNCPDGLIFSVERKGCVIDPRGPLR
jgi:hypothetical protein